MPRWILTDLDTSTSYNFEINPSDAGETRQRSPVYSSPSGLSNEVSILAARSSARTESATGKLLSRDQYFALLGWWQKAKLVQLTDDLGQVSNILITNFEPAREHSIEAPWKHSYTFTYLVLEPTVTVDGYAGETITYPLTTYGPPTGLTQIILYEYNSGSVGHSEDLGVTWDSVVLPYDSTNWFAPQCWSGMWNGSYWLIAGHITRRSDFWSKSVAYKSADGISWTEITISTNTTATYSFLWGLAWNGSVWLAAGSSFTDSLETVAISSDGESWSFANTPLDGEGTDSGGGGFGVAWNGSKWVVVGQSGDSSITLITSPNGTTWTAQTTPMDDLTSNGDSTAYTVVWSPGLSEWVVAGYHYNASEADPPYGFQDEPAIMTSPDGVNWTSRVSPMDTNYAGQISWNGAQYVATGEAIDGSGFHPVQVSADGVTWTLASSISGHNFSQSLVCWDGTQWMCSLGGGLQTLVRSADGQTWTLVTTGISAFDTTNELLLVASRPNYVYPGAT